MYITGGLLGTYSFVLESVPGFNAFDNFCTLWLAGNRGGLFYAFPLIMLGRFFAIKKPKRSWITWGILSVVSTAILLIEALMRRSLAGNTGIDNDIMLIPIVFCLLGFLTTVNIPQGAYAVFLRKMSVLIFVTQRLFLTVIPELLPTKITEAIFANVYVGALFACGGTIVFSILIIVLSNKFTWLKKIY